MAAEEYSEKALEEVGQAVDLDPKCVLAIATMVHALEEAERTTGLCLGDPHWNEARRSNRRPRATAKYVSHRRFRSYSRPTGSKSSGFGGPLRLSGYCPGRAQNSLPPIEARLRDPFLAAERRDAQPAAGVPLEHGPPVRPLLLVFLLAMTIPPGHRAQAPCPSVYQPPQGCRSEDGNDRGTGAPGASPRRVGRLGRPDPRSAGRRLCAAVDDTQRVPATGAAPCRVANRGDRLPATY